MSDWQDYALGGGTGAASGAATGGMMAGPWGALAGGVIGGGLGLFSTYKGKQGANSVKAAYDQAYNQTGQMSQELRALLDQRRSEALGYYKPIQNMFKTAYGDAGVAAPVTPQVPGSRPLDAMYGKGR